MQNNTDKNKLFSEEMVPSQAPSNYMLESKKTYQNPIFSKLNKIFVDPKQKINNRQQQNPVIQQFKTQTNKHEKQTNSSSQVNFLLKPDISMRKDQLKTSQTQTSRAFLISNPSSFELKQIFLNQNNFQFFNVNSFQGKDKFLLNKKPNEGKQNIFQVDQSFNLKNNKLQNNGAINKLYSKSTNDLLSNVQNHWNNERFFYENHKLQRIHKPRLVSSIPVEQVQLQNQQPKQFFHQKVKHNHIPFSSTLQSKHFEILPPQPLSYYSSHYQARISQLQQKVQYHQKIQQFYLDQIQTYREDKKTLEWKLNLIVEELLWVTMKHKSIMKGSNKFNQSLIKHSKQLILSKIHQLDFSTNKKISELIMEDNKENIYSGNFIEESQVVQIVDLENIDFGRKKVDTDQLKLPLWHDIGLDASSRYVSSFMLDNVTLVESEEEEQQNQEHFEQNSQKRLLEKKIEYCHKEQVFGLPQVLSFV